MPIKHPALPWVLPMAVFILFLAIGDVFGLGPWEYVLRCIVLSAVLVIFSRRVIDLRVNFIWASIALGFAVFAIWIAPDLLIPGYRTHWLFQNSITGKVSSSMASNHQQDTWVLVFRAVRAVILVPIIEELFWRGWLMRWLVDRDFEKVPLGTYTGEAFWLPALLFAAEHGPYWEVGLAAGIAFNWWMVRSKSLGDCILAHAAANAALSAYVVLAGKWEYWL
ncbi:MAG: CAAX prenyl protease-related protein [Bryobacteraceae bacterium]